MRRRMRWLVAAMIVAGGAVPALPAHAYDAGTCNETYGASHVRRVVQFNVDTGLEADFGDHNHWFGAPQGTAVICWLDNGGVKLHGFVFADTYDQGFIKARATFWRSDGTSFSREAEITQEHRDWNSLPAFKGLNAGPRDGGYNAVTLSLWWQEWYGFSERQYVKTWVR